MADTNFVSKITKIATDWANDVNKLRYGADDPTRGSALLQFIQAGTGAVTRTVQDELREQCKVTQFDGTDPTGNSSSLTGFQAAIDSTPDVASVVVVRVPSGIYEGDLATLNVGNRTLVWHEEGRVTYSTSEPAGYRWTGTKFKQGSHAYSSVAANNSSIVSWGFNFPSGDASQSLAFISGRVPSTYAPSGTAAHQLNLLHVRVADDHTNSGVGEQEGVVAGFFHAYLNTGVTNSRCWALNPYVQIIDTADGQCNALEANVENDGLSQSDPTQANSKRGIIVALKDTTSGGTTQPGTVAYQIQDSPSNVGWHHGIYAAAESIETGGNLIWHNGISKINGLGAFAFGTDTIPASTHGRIYTTDAINLVRFDRDSNATGISHKFDFAADNFGGASKIYSEIATHVIDNTDGNEGGRISFWTQQAGTLTNGGYVQLGWVIGTPTGGDKGLGTVNAVAVYDDNVLLTCYVAEAWVDGQINQARWDAATPNRVIEEAGKPVREEVRTHERAAGFATVASDRLDVEKFSQYIRDNKRLPAFPGPEKWESDFGAKMAVGDVLQRLWETVEVQAVHIAKLHDRLKALEGK